MATNSLTTRNSGDTITSDFFNSIHSAISTEFVGRNSSGVPTASQPLGTVALPWGVIRASSLILNGSAVDTSQLTSPVNRVVSGKMRSTSNQPAFITPSGAGATATIDATPTQLVLDINGTAVSVASDIALSGLTLAPSVNNTCLVDDAMAIDQASTRTWGEVNAEIDYITVDTMGSNITAKIGTYAAFMIDNGTSTEYCIGFVESATRISNLMRGFFYDSSLNPKNRVVFSNNDTITLLSWGHIFVENDGTTADVTYRVPHWSSVAPGSPATGDYWYDIPNQVWKRYDGASFQIINRTLIGSVVLTSANCVGARCQDFYAKVDAFNNLLPRFSTTEIAQVKTEFGAVSVMGQLIQFGNTRPSWNITTDRASTPDSYSGSEGASTPYYLYVKDTGAVAMSDISPYYRADLQGSYHPHNPWRCVGIAWNNAGSNIQTVAYYDPFHTSPEHIICRADDSDANQSIPNGTDTVVQFNREVGGATQDQHDSDPFGILDSANYRFVAPIPGYYAMEINTTLEASAAAYTAYLYARVNGTSARSLQVSNKSGTANQPHGMRLIDSTWMNAGDYMEILMQQNSGGALGLVTGFDPLANTATLKLMPGIG